MKFLRVLAFFAIALLSMRAAISHAQEVDLLYIKLPEDAAERPKRLVVDGKYTFIIDDHTQTLGSGSSRGSYFVVPLSTLLAFYGQERVTDLPSAMTFEFGFRDARSTSKPGDRQRLYFFPVRWRDFRQRNIDGAGAGASQRAVAEATLVSWGRFSNCFPAVIPRLAPSGGTTHKSRVVWNLFWLQRIDATGGCRQHPPTRERVRNYISVYSTHVEPSTYYLSTSKEPT